MSSIMTKTVELQYSGTGKVINGQSKRNFSNTNSYICLKGNNNSFNINFDDLYSLCINKFYSNIFVINILK